MMTSPGCLLSLFTVLWWTQAGYSHKVSAGHLLLLRCPVINVTWRRGGNITGSLPAGIKVKDGDLWFLPAEAAHNGSYICRKNSNIRGRWWEMEFNVWVSESRCPGHVDMKVIPMGTTQTVPCKLDVLLGVSSSPQFQWLKECVNPEQGGPRLEVNEKGSLRLRNASERDSGLYTCLLHLSLQGRNYTAARTIRLTVERVPVFKLPVVFPKQQTVGVKLGSRTELKCQAYVGTAEFTINWMVDHDFAEKYHLNYTKSTEGVNIRTSLVISRVVSEHLQVPIRCYVKNPVGQDYCEVWLHIADQRGFFTCLSVLLTLCLLTLLLVMGFLCFKPDLVLAYRKLRMLLVQQQTSDGKLYDAYVSYLYGNAGGVSEALTFALRVLPEVMEKRHGYKLFIRGRDDCPGAALHDIIAEALCMSRRLIIILSASPEVQESSPLHHSQNQLAYEYTIGLYDALTQNGLQVIMVEIDGPVDYSGLSETLRYIKRRQGALKWRGASTGTHACIRFFSERSFWKSLRYHMPPAPGGASQSSRATAHTATDGPHAFTVLDS